MGKLKDKKQRSEGDGFGFGSSNSSNSNDTQIERKNQLPLEILNLMFYKGETANENQSGNYEGSQEN